MLTTYSKISYCYDWNHGECNTITLKAKTTSGRAWRKFICQYLIDDMLELVSGHEEDPKLLALVNVLPLIDHGMCYTAAKYLEKIESIQEWNVTQWLISNLYAIEISSNWVEPDGEFDRITGEPIVDETEETEEPPTDVAPSLVDSNGGSVFNNVTDIFNNSNSAMLAQANAVNQNVLASLM